MDSGTVMLWGLLFGAIGTGYFVYGKKQRMAVALFCGVGLVASPYLVPNLYGMILLGIVLMIIPYHVRY